MMSSSSTAVANAIKIKFHNIKKFYADNDLFIDVSGQVRHGDKIGLIGENGSGKTTLVKILIGEIPHNYGTVERNTDDIAYIPQEIITENRDKSIVDYAFGVTSVSDQYFALRNAEKEIKSDMDTYLKELANFQEVGGYEVQKNLNLLLKKADLEEDIWGKSFSSLSEGQKRLVYMVGVMAEDPEVLVLDEPTNHVDSELKQRYIKLIDDFVGAVITVTHDREVLSKACNRIWEIEDKVLQIYKGNWEFYEEEHERRLLNQIRTYSKNEKKLDQLYELKEVFQKKASMDAKYKGTLSNIKKRIARIESAMPGIKPTMEKESLEAEISYEGKSSRFPLKVRGLTAMTDEELLFENLNLELMKGESVAVTGRNGCGKSTLMKIILDDCSYAKWEGEIMIPESVNIGYFNQKLTFEDERQTLYEYIAETLDVGPNKIYGAMDKYLFLKSQKDVELRGFSGGERNRLHLMRLIEGNCNLLLLDEPTNHLDLYAVEALEGMLKKYNGTVLLISHDNYFVQNTTDRAISID